MHRVMGEVYAARGVIGACLVIAVAVTFVLIAFMRCCAGPIVCFAITATLLALMVITGTLYYAAIDAHKHKVGDTPTHTPALATRTRPLSVCRLHRLCITTFCH